MFLIGSRKDKKEGDWDLVLEDEDIQKSKTIDIAPKDLPLLEVCKQYATGDVIETPVGLAKTVSNTGLMLIRRSHLHRPINFAKHIRVYHELKRYWKTDQHYYSLLLKLTKATKEKYGDRTPKLNKKKGEFFDDYVTKYYEHDWLHQVTCYYDKPIYTRLQRDSDRVWCDKELWYGLSYQDKVKCVQEECFVIALERYIIPKLENCEKHPPPHFAFSWALERVCTTLTSGFFRHFAIENWPVISVFNNNFLEKFHESK